MREVVGRMGKKPMKLNRLKNKTKTESKNRLTEPSGLILFFFFYTNLSFNLGFDLQNIKTVVSVNQLEIYILKNRLIEPSGLILVLFYTNLGFDLSFGLQNTKTVVSINQLNTYINSLLM